MKKLLFLLLLAPSLVYGQATAVKYESFTWTTNRIGGIRPVVPIPDAKVQVCNFPANAVPCSNYATTYTDVSATAVCNGTNGCSNPITTDDNGKFGFWVLPGIYQYTYTSGNGLNFGPYTVTLGISGTVVATDHFLLSTTHPDTVPYTPPLFGDWIQGNGSSKWEAQHGNAATTPKWFKSVGDGTNVTFQGPASAGGPCPSGQYETGINADLTPVCAAITFPSQTPDTPPAPFAIPSGQAVAWAYPNTCSTLASNEGTIYFSWANDGRASYQCGPTGGVLSRYVSSPLGIPFYEIKWTGFSMPTLPGDAVIQHIYPVFIGVRPNVFGGDLVACGSGATEDTIFSSTSATYGGYFSSSTSLGSTSSAVTNAYCYVNNGISLSATGLDTQTVQLFALAIYYTSATPLPTNSSSFFAFPYYSAINGLSIPFASVADGSPITFDAAYNFITNKYTTLNHTTATRALNVTNMQNGGDYVMEFIQDSTGAAAVTAGTGCTWVNPDGSTFSPSIGTGANTHSFIQWHYDGGSCLVTGTGSGSGGMVYPGAGVAVSTGSAWGSSLTAPSGAIVGTTDTQTLTNKNLASGTNTFPTFNQNTTGTAANLSGTPALPNGTTATTQTAGDASTKLATTAYVDSAVAGGGGGNLSGTLTAGKISKATAAHTVADSALSDDGTTLSYSGTGGMSFPGAFTDSGTKVAGTSCTVASGDDFAICVGSTNQFLCTLSAGLGGGSCLPSGSAPAGTGVPQVSSGSWGTTVDMGTAANVPLVSDGSHGAQLANGKLSTGGTGTSIYDVTATTIGNLGTLAGLTANISEVQVTDGATCGDTTTGGGSINETLRYLGSSTWGVVACGNTSGTASGLFNGAIYVPTTSGTGFTTALNQSATFSATNASTGIQLKETTPQGSTNAYEGIVGTYPTAPFTKTFLFSFPEPQSNFQRIGIIATSTTASSSPGIIWYWGTGSSAIDSIHGYQISSLTNSATFTAITTQTLLKYPEYLWLRWADDGTNIIVSYSNDGSNFVQMNSSTKASLNLNSGGFNYLGVFFFNQASSGTGSATLLSYN